MKNAVAIWVWLCAWLNLRRLVAVCHPSTLNAPGLHWLSWPLEVAAFLIGKKLWPPTPQISSHNPLRLRKFLGRFQKAFSTGFFNFIRPGLRRGASFMNLPPLRRPVLSSPPRTKLAG